MTAAGCAIAFACVAAGVVIGGVAVWIYFEYIIGKAIRKGMGW